MILTGKFILLPVCVQLLSHVLCFATTWTEPFRVLCPWDFQARIPEWVAISYSRGIFPTQGLNRVSCMSCFGRQISLPPHHLGSPLLSLLQIKSVILPFYFFNYESMITHLQETLKNTEQSYI